MHIKSDRSLTAANTIDVAVKYKRLRTVALSVNTNIYRNKDNTAENFKINSH